METNIIPFRSAFILYKEKGIDAVISEFPECVEFVEQYKDLSVEEVTRLLIKMLDDVRGSDLPASA